MIISNKYRELLYSDGVCGDIDNRISSGVSKWESRVRVGAEKGEEKKWYTNTQKEWAHKTNTELNVSDRKQEGTRLL